MTEIDPIERLPTGINGFDQVALGGLPAGRPTLVSGTTGSGKTVFAVEFLARGIAQRGEPGVFVTFEEVPEGIRRNVASLGFPIGRWEDEGKWAFVDAAVGLAEEASVIGAYGFGTLASRIEYAVRRIGATIALRYFEQGGEIHRAITVLQARGSAHDHAIREVAIDADGMHIGEPVTGAAGILDSVSSRPYLGPPHDSIWPRGRAGND